MKEPKILLVGCGAMGSALKQGVAQGKISVEMTVIDPANDSCLPSLSSLPASYCPHMIVFAVKPQLLPQVLPLYRQFYGQGCLFLSLAAGVALATYHHILGQEEQIIRAMPNLPVTVGQGMTALITQRPLNDQQRPLAELLFRALGQIIWLEDERLMDVVTAVSGSGPAYFFRLVECLAAAGVAGGLSPDVAMTLARQTAIGAGALLQSLPESVTDLRRRVTSPGGTTAAALSVFDQEDALATVTSAAVKAAIQRGRELSQ